jgi:hypothetical protein
MPRPGVSYISGADENQPRPAYRNNPTLPQAPQIQRADQGPDNRNVPASDQRFQRFQSNRTVQQESPSPAAPTRSTDELRFQRAAPDNPNVPASDERFQRNQSNRTMRQDSPTPATPMRNNDEPRFQRAEPAPRSYVREQPQPQPMPAPTRSERPQPTFQQPRYQPPPQRAETPRPQHSESRPAQKSAPRVRDDAQEH